MDNHTAYVINVSQMDDELPHHSQLSDEQFIKIATEQDNVLSIRDFVLAFNNDDGINSYDQVMRIINHNSVSNG